MKALFVSVSANAKTGPIPATITERGSCWSGCALYEKGCYAFHGALGHFWSGVSDGTRGGSWDELCTKVAALPKRTLWRYAQAGDLPGTDDAIDARLLWQLVVANRGKRALAFTHKPVLPDTPVAARNRSAKSRPDEWAETIAEWRDRIADLPRRTPAGRRIAICPATYSNATCKSRGACAEPRDAVIGFPAHGAWRMVEKATAARDVPPGQSRVFHDHRTMAKVIADEKSVNP